MRKKILNPSIIVLVFTVLLACMSCNKGTGCLINESAHVKMGKDGKLPTTRGTSSLFPRDFKKKRKKSK